MVLIIDPTKPVCFIVKRYWQKDLQSNLEGTYLKDTLYTHLQRVNGIWYQVSRASYFSFRYVKFSVWIWIASNDNKSSFC